MPRFAMALVSHHDHGSNAPKTAPTCCRTCLERIPWPLTDDASAAFVWSQQASRPAPVPCPWRVSLQAAGHCASHRSCRTKHDVCHHGHLPMQAVLRGQYCPTVRRSYEAILRLRQGCHGCACSLHAASQFQGVRSEHCSTCRVSCHNWGPKCQQAMKNLWPMAVRQQVS